MPTETILALLITERDKLNRAIEALQTPQKRRGRPPKSAAPAVTEAAAPVERRVRTFSEAQRKAASERMRKMWAKKRKAAASE